MIEKEYNHNEKIIYTNGLLHSIQLLNLAPNSGKNYGFVELNFSSNDLTENLRSYLQTPKWIFNFIKLNQDWKKTIIKDTKWAFTDIITENHGYPFEIGIEKYELLTKKYNIEIVQEHILSNIENVLNSFNGFEVYQIEIGEIEANDNSGYFAHGESNYIFKTTDKNMFLLYFRASD